jgi:hypothetical protein
LEILDIAELPLESVSLVWQNVVFMATPCHEKCLTCEGSSFSLNFTTWSNFLSPAFCIMFQEMLTNSQRQHSLDCNMHNKKSTVFDARRSISVHFHVAGVVKIDSHRIWSAPESGLTFSVSWECHFCVAIIKTKIVWSVFESADLPGSKFFRLPGVAVWPVMSALLLPFQAFIAYIGHITRVVEWWANKMGLVAEEFCLGWLLLLLWAMVLQRNYSDSPSLFESPNFQMQLHNREMNTDDTNPTVIGAQYQSWKSCPAR